MRSTYGRGRQTASPAVFGRVKRAPATTMDTCVTGIFSDRAAADVATRALVAVGFRRDHVEVLDASSVRRGRRVALRVADTRRASTAGALLGGIGGAGSALLAGTGGVAALAAGLALALAGAALGMAIGRSTTSQIRAELDGELDAGRVLVTVTTDAAHSALLASILAGEGGASVVSSRASFRAAILGAKAT